MNLREKLLLQQVKRYPICHMNRDQSVAEHSYNVLLIALELIADSSDRILKEEVMLYAIEHDMNEVETGDIPSPFKRRLRLECPAVTKTLDGEKDVSKEAYQIVKLADSLEAIYYIKQFGGSQYTMLQIFPDVVQNFRRIVEQSNLPEAIINKALNMEHFL